MEIIVKVTDAELKEMDMTARDLQACIFDDVVNSDNQCVEHEYSPMTVEVVSTDAAKRAIKTTKDKHMAIINNKYEGWGMENNLTIMFDVTKHLTECWTATKIQGFGEWSGIYDIAHDLYNESQPATFDKVFKFINSNGNSKQFKIYALESIASDLSVFLGVR